jgi:hypothetical protein
MVDDSIPALRVRAAMALRLADSILDSNATESLRQMAAEIEAEILKLETARMEQNEIPPASIE